MLNNSGIYLIKSPAGKYYVGQSCNMELRLHQYKIGKCKEQPKLYESFYNYGILNHKFEVLEYCEKEELYNKERYWQDRYNVLGDNGLNLTLEQSKDYNKVLSKDTKDKISRSLKGIDVVNRKRVICNNTGKIYKSIKECADENKICYSFLKRLLRENRTKEYSYYEINNA